MRSAMKTLGVMVAALSMIGAAKAQEFPGLGVGNLWAANMAFDQQMDQAARNYAAQWYQERQAYRHASGDWGYLPGPFTTQDLVRANNETANAYAGYNASWAQNSARTSAAVGNFSTQAIRGLGTYGDGMGSTYQLPNTWNGYYLNNYNQAYGTNSFVPPNPWQNFTTLYPMN